MSSVNTTHIDGDVSVGRNVAMGGNATIQGNATIANNLVVRGKVKADNIITNNKGIFKTLAALQAAYPNPKAGWFAGVGAGSPFDVYTVNSSGAWEASGGTMEFDVELDELSEQVDSIEGRLSEVEDGKQDVLTFDDTPTEGSTNPVTSEGVKAALEGVNTVKSKNLAIESLVTPDKKIRYTGGVEVTGNSLAVTHYIPVTAGKVYAVGYGIYTTLFAFYNSDKTFYGVLKQSDGTTDAEDFTTAYFDDAAKGGVSNGWSYVVAPVTGFVRFTVKTTTPANNPNAYARWNETTEIKDPNVIIKEFDAVGDLLKESPSEAWELGGQTCNKDLYETSFYKKRVLFPMYLTFNQGTYTFGQNNQVVGGFVLKVNKGDIISFNKIFGSASSYAVLLVPTNSFPQIGTVLTNPTLITSSKYQDFFQYKVEDYKYLFIRATTGNVSNICINGIDVTSGFYGDYPQVYEQEEKDKRLDVKFTTDVKIGQGNLTNPSKLQYARTENYLPGRISVELNEGYMFTRIEVVDRSMTSSPYRYTIHTKASLKNYLSLNYDGYVKFEVCRADNENIDPSEFSSIVKKIEINNTNISNVLADSEYKNLLLPTSDTTYPLVAKAVRDYIADVDYSEDPDYTTTEAPDYYGDICYERALPVRISWLPVKNALQYLIAYNQNTSGEITWTGNNITVDGLENHYDLYNLIPGKRYFYAIQAVTLDGTLQGVSVGTFLTDSCPLRIMHIPNIVNCRDIGGWSANGGVNSIAYGKVYRSAALSRREGHIITPEGSEECARLGITKEIGLGVNYPHSPISMTTTFVDYPIGTSSSGSGIYGNMMTDSSQNVVTVMREILATLAAGQACIYHCAGGADRTGIISWLLLGLCGVSESDLSKDYEMTSFTASANRRVRTQSTGIMTVAAIIKEYQGESLKEQIEAWFLEKGLTQAEINSIRSYLVV